MKVKIFGLGIFCFVLLMVSSCTKKNVDPNLMGSWQAIETGLTVRVEPSFMKFEFIGGQADCLLEIHEDLRVTGTIGGALLQDAKIVPNSGVLPNDITGVSHKIHCRLKGKIFPEDPLPDKEVQLWVLTGEAKDAFRAELRFTEKGAQFPMTEFEFSRIER